MVSNRASRVAEAGWQGLRAHDPRAVAAIYSNEVFYDDQRSISGTSADGILDFHNAAERLVADYPNVEWRTCAVRGEALVLIWARLWDDDGNETTSFNVLELASDGLVGYHGRFDGDDFEGAYGELERRYYEGEGAEFAENGRTVCAWADAVARRDVEAARRLSWPDFRWLASPSSLKPEERTVDEFFHWLDERTQQLSSMRSWPATIQWLSPNCFILLNEIHGTGTDGDQYLWEWIHVGEYRDGLAVSMREFDVADEDAAFAYAESLVAPKQRRLAVSNAASRAVDRAVRGLQANDADAIQGLLSPRIVYEDRRPFAGALVTGVEYVSETIPPCWRSSTTSRAHALAVRGDRVCLAWSRWSDNAGNASSNLHVIELGDDDSSSRYLYFDDDDFWSAYREWKRYYSGEGAQFAECGLASAEWVMAISNADIEGVRHVSHPEFRWIATPSALKDAERTVDDMFRWMQERGRQVCVPAALGAGRALAVTDVRRRSRRDRRSRRRRRGIRLEFHLRRRVPRRTTGGRPRVR